MQLQMAKLTSLLEKKQTDGAAMMEDDGEVTYDDEDENDIMVKAVTIFGDKESIFSPGRWDQAMLPAQCNLLRQYVRDHVRITQRRGELCSLIDSIETRNPNLRVIRASIPGQGLEKDLGSQGRRDMDRRWHYRPSTAANARRTWWTSTKISSRRSKRSGRKMQPAEKGTGMTRADADMDAEMDTTDTGAETDGGEEATVVSGRPLTTYKKRKAGDHQAAAQIIDRSYATNSQYEFSKTARKLDEFTKTLDSQTANDPIEAAMHFIAEHLIRKNKPNTLRNYANHIATIWRITGKRFLQEDYRWLLMTRGLDKMIAEDTNIASYSTRYPRHQRNTKRTDRQQSQSLSSAGLRPADSATWRDSAQRTYH
eukprot:gene18465-99_t